MLPDQTNSWISASIQTFSTQIVAELHFDWVVYSLAQLSQGCLTILQEENVVFFVTNLVTLGVGTQSGQAVTAAAASLLTADNKMPCRPLSSLYRRNNTISHRCPSPSLIPPSHPSQASLHTAALQHPLLQTTLCIHCHCHETIELTCILFPADNCKIVFFSLGLRPKLSLLTTTDDWTFWLLASLKRLDPTES